MQLTRIDLDDARTIALSSNELGFLRKLGNPCYLTIPGNDIGAAPIVITTLLHGNEPSGLKALHQLLCAHYVPQVTLVFIIASISAALTEPVFTYRMLPGAKDLNRCFGEGRLNEQKTDAQYYLADAISACIMQHSPSCVIDIHNTSGNGPCFAVATSADDNHKALASYFCERMIVTDIRLGALMELNVGCPIITFEAGGAYDPLSDYHAKQGIINLSSEPSFHNEIATLDLLIHPRRVLLGTMNTLSYCDTPLAHVDLCLRSDIERFNFQETPAHTVIGWCNVEPELILSTDKPSVSITDGFYVRDGQLYTKKPLILFMITTRADIAKSDCLFYYVER